MKKVITDKLINERLEAKGFGDEQANDPELTRKAVLDYYSVKLIDEWDDSADFFIYEESSADGYSLFIATHNPNELSISEDVYYYDHDLGDALTDAIKWGNGDTEYPDKIYVDDLNAQYIDDAIVNLFDYLATRFEEEVINELKNEGYEYENED